MSYGDIKRNGEVIGGVFYAKEGCTAQVWINGAEYSEDFFIKNPKDLKMSVNFWIENILKRSHIN